MFTKFVIEPGFAAKLRASPVLGAGGKPSTRFPPGTLVELSDFREVLRLKFKKIQEFEKTEKNEKVSYSRFFKKSIKMFKHLKI